MRTSTVVGCFKAVALMLSFVVICAAHPALGGEFSVYLKSGWFTWDEKLNDNPFVKESGAMFGAGINNRDMFAQFSVAENAEVWGGNLDYDGHDITGSTDLKSDTSYLGTREEVFVGFRVPVTERASVEPILGAGHKFWRRTRSGEDWNTIYTKAGLRGELKQGSHSFFVKGGALLPVYTRSHVSLGNAGYTDVVTRPEPRVSAFGEAGIQFHAWAVSVEYEEMRFGRSEMVTTSKLNMATGAVIQNSKAFQPESEANFVSLKIAYSF